VADQRMPGMLGIDVIRRALELRPRIAPIILTGYTDLDVLVDALNLGRVHRYLSKPWDSRELRLAITRAIESCHLAAENERLATENARLVEDLQRANATLAAQNMYLKAQHAQGAAFSAIVGESPALAQALALARRVGKSDATVLLEGRSGTGKEMFAKAIHFESSRRDQLFVPVNCGGLTETLLESALFGHRKGAFTGASADRRGLFEMADGGTLFLDEVGEASRALQVVLLRVLQEGEVLPVGGTRPVKVDVRIIAATNKDLREEVARGAFREDLYFRLRVFPIALPTLRERAEDIPMLVSHFLAKHAAMLKRPSVPDVSPEALAILARQEFSGNVRELENLVQRALILADADEPLDTRHLLDLGLSSTSEPQDLGTELSRLERELISRAIDCAGGNKTRAAEQLGLTYRGLLKKIDRLGLR